MCCQAQPPHGSTPDGCAGPKCRHASATSAVAHVGWNGERALPAHFHAGYALIPAADHFAGAEAEVERLVAIARAVELAPLVIGLRFVVQPAGVMHRHPLA